MKIGKKGIGILIIILVLGISMTIFSAGNLLKVKGEEKPSITFEKFSSKTTIEDSVIFIGTHLIHIQSMTDTLYETALQSASKEEQSKVYYKSELAKGAWFDITDALGLEDISETGRIVMPEEMKNLKVEYYTFKDGITRSALTGNPMNIFNIKEPYNLYELEELEAIKQQFEEQFSAEDTGVKKYYYDQLKKFFEQEVRNDVTTECDRQLNGLQTLYTSLVTAEKKELAEIVVKIMEKVDSKRRAEVLYQLSQSDNHLLNALQEVCTGSEYDKEEYILLIEEETTEEETTEEETTEEETTEEETTEEETTEEETTEEGTTEEEKGKTIRKEREQFVENSGVLDAIASSLQACQTSYTNHIGNSLEKGSTIIKNMEYEKSMQVINQAGIGAEAIIQELELLFNIQDDLVVQEGAELQMIESQLLPKAEEKYKGQVSGGVGEEYKVSVANGVSQAAIEQTLNRQKTSTNTALQELEFMISAQTKRQVPEDALNGIYDRLDSIPGLKGLVKQDAFRTKAAESLDEYRIWLLEKAKAIIEENEELASEMDKLEASKEELMTEYQQALDENDLALAKKKMATIELLDEEMEKKQQELQSILEHPDSSESDKAKAHNQAGNSTLLNQIESMKQEALLGLAEGKEEIGNTLDALEALGAEEALKEIAATATESGKDRIAKEAQAAAEESQNSEFYKKEGESAGAGSLEAVRVNQQIEEYYGDPFTKLKNEEKAQVIVVVDFLLKDGYISLRDLFDEYYEDYYEEANNQKTNSEKAENDQTTAKEEGGRDSQRSSADTTGLQQTIPVNNGNTAVFQCVKRGEGKYAPLRVVAKLLDYRYIFDDSRKEVTLSKGSKTYHIKANDTGLLTYPDKTETLQRRPIYQSDLYLGEEDLLSLFGCRVFYLEKINMGICLTEKMYEEAEELYQQITEGEE
ncbi:MAG: hypothetical protein IKL51_05485 [Lachnospiraceae bacterium]|nr:hypothetical protein [Lachnospiraceae bacterium]